MDLPSRVYLCLAGVQKAVEAPDLLPRKVVETGYYELIARAAKISDADWQRLFLENVAESREMVAPWHEIETVDLS